MTGDIAYRLSDRWSVRASVFNLLDASVDDVDYYYRSRLPGEPPGGIDAIHTHPAPPRTLRVGVVATF